MAGSATVWVKVRYRRQWPLRPAFVVMRAAVRLRVPRLGVAAANALLRLAPIEYSVDDGRTWKRREFPLLEWEVE